MVAYDAAGNVSSASSDSSATTYDIGPSVDVIPPSVPTNVVAMAASSSQINLSWSASIDNVGVVGYHVYRNGSLIATTTATTYQDTNLEVGIQYSYTIDAYDAADNISPQSASASATPACTTIPGGQGMASVQFTYVPPVGSDNNLTGQVFHVVPANYYVAVFIRVNGGWWTKPYFDSPATPINCDGTWTCDITTGGIDEQADAISAFVLPATYTVPLASGQASIPDGVAANAVASVSASR